MFDVVAPVRTITLLPPIKIIYRSCQGSKLEKIPIVFHNRHLGCIKDKASGAFITVSHTWQHAVLVAHTSRTITTEAVCRVFNTPTQLLRAAVQSWGEETEIWHDYIGVPQWRYEVQQRLLVMLPLIFNWGSRTLVHLQDIPRSMVLKMRNGAT